MIDTHCHLNLIISRDPNHILDKKELGAAAAIIKRAQAAGVTHVINIGASLADSFNSVNLARAYPMIYAVIGVHPNDLTPDWQNDFEEIKKLLKKKEEHKIVGIGETGIDTYRPGYHLQRQQDAFHAHIELALEHDLPVVIHTRAAPQETLAVMHEYRQNNLRGVIHCFAYDLAFARDVIANGFYVGIGGVVTYPRSHLAEVVEAIDLKHILLETDAPFLPPQQWRGQSNEPAYLPAVAQKIAEIKNISLHVVDEITTQSAHVLFGILN